MEVTWVKADILPDSDLTVLVHMPGCDNPVAMGFHDGDFWFDDLGAPLRGRNAVTHWMMLPVPPEVKP